MDCNRLLMMMILMWLSYGHACSHAACPDAALMEDLSKAISLILICILQCLESIPSRAKTDILPNINARRSNYLHYSIRNFRRLNFRAQNDYDKQFALYAGID